MHEPARILVADDDPGCRAILTAILERAGFQVVGAATNGEEAVRLAQALRPDGITMDLEMPVVDGVEATRTICASEFAAPIVIVSLSHTPDDLEATRAAGALGFVRKSDALEALATAVADALADSAAVPSHVSTASRSSQERVTAWRRVPAATANVPRAPVARPC